MVADTVNEQPCVFLPHLRHAEDAIAMAIRHLQAGRPPWAAIDAVKAIDWVEARLGVRLAPGQRGAVSKALSSKILIVTGGPGVGKTTIIRGILTILQAKGVTPFWRLQPAGPQSACRKPPGLKQRPFIGCWS